jgi:hypothetical protein
MSLPAKHSTLLQQITALTEQLAPAGPDEIAVCLNGLMNGGMMISASIQADNPVDEYRLALSGAPIAGLRKAFLKLKRGEYENINYAFIPLPSELAAMARAEARVLREDRVRLQEKAEALNTPKAKEISPEGRARIKGLLNVFRSEHAAAKAIGTAPKEPMSEAKAEYYQKIMEMRDAPGVNREHEVFRNHISAEIEARKDLA